MKRGRARAPRTLRAIALTGTPGTGKSTVAHRLRPPLKAAEVGDLALALGVGRRSRSAITVDLPRLADRLLRLPRVGQPDVIVGYLAHRLPVARAVVLRLHPLDLDRRLRQRGDGDAERIANVGAEALDLMAIEARNAGAPVVEIDVTGRSAAGVARTVEALVRDRPPSRRANPRWLADARVTDWLLRHAR